MDRFQYLNRAYSPRYRPASPRYRPDSPQYTPDSPAYHPSPARKRRSDADDTITKSVRRKIHDAPKYGTDIITIKVGPERQQQIFTAHKDLLSAHSDYFRAATDRRWREGQEKKVPLANESPKIFQIFQHFIYSGQIFSSEAGDRAEPNETGIGTDDEWQRLSDAWILGDRLLSTSFKDAVVDAIIAKLQSDRQHPTEVQNQIYPASHKTAQVRKLIVDIAVYSWRETAFESMDFGEPSEFLCDLAIALSKTGTIERLGPAPFEDGHGCKYHERGEEGTCYKKMF